MAKKLLAVGAVLLSATIALAAGVGGEETSEISGKTTGLRTEPNGRNLCILKKGTPCYPLMTMQDNRGQNWAKVAIIGWVKADMVRDIPQQVENVEDSTVSKSDLLSETLGKWDGFRGLPWAVQLGPISAKDFVELEDDGQGTKYFSRDGDNLTIGQAELTKVAYGFYKGHFMSVIIKAKGARNFDGLKKALTARYGNPRRPNQFIEEYYWVGNSVFMVLELNEFSSDIDLTLLYEPLQDLRELDKKAAAEKAGKDF